MGFGQHNKEMLMVWPKRDPFYARLVLSLIVLTTLWRIWAGAMVGFGIGEAYYLASARAVHLSYFDQPPLFLWVLWATKQIVPGEAPVLLRLPFILMFAMSTWVIFRLGVRVQSERTGWIAALLFNISLLFQVSIGGWAQPEAPLMLFWLLTVWYLLDIFGGAPSAPLKSWAMVGLMLGLTFLSKYHAVFLLYGAGLFALIAPSARKWVVHPGPYLAILIAAAIGSPVLIWNWQNDFISFTFQGARAFGDDFSLLRLLRMIVGQLIYITPWLALPALFAGAFALIKGPGSKWPSAHQPGTAFFFLMLAHGPILLFTAVAAWSETQFHFHWQAPGYMMLFLVLAMWMDTAWARRKALLSAFLVLATIANFALMGVLVTHTATGWLRNVVPGFDQGVDPTRDALPWNALADFFAQEGALEENNFVAGVHWTECGHVDNAAAGQVPFLCISTDPRNIAFNVDPTSLEGQTGYVATSVWPHEAIMGSFGQYFEQFGQVGEVNIERSGRAELAPVRIYRGDGLIIDREFEITAEGKYELPLLPLIKITRVTGQTDMSDLPTQITAIVDGENIGSAQIVDGRFAIKANMAATLSRRTVTLRLETAEGEPLRAGSVKVELGFHQ